MELIISIIGAVVAILLSILGSYYSIKNNIKLQKRKLKEDYYTSYIKALHNWASDNNSVKFKTEYTFYRDSLLIIADQDVINAILVYEEKRASKDTNEYFKILIKAMRSDLKLPSEKIKDISLIK